MKSKIFLSLFLICNVGFSQNYSKDVEVKKLIELVGAKEKMKSISENVFSFRENQDTILIKSENWKKFKENAIDYDELVNRLVPVYKKHLTTEEIEALVDFYNSPAGKAMTEKFPLIAKESTNVGIGWSDDLYNKIEAKFDQPLVDKFNSPIKKCSSLEEGRFRYFDSSGNQVIVIRQDGYQEEIVEGELYKLKIEWVEDCQYKVWNYQEDNKYEEVDATIVSIYEMNDNNYKFIFTQENARGYFEGEMEIIK
jgi:hypothetical protein